MALTAFFPLFLRSFGGVDAWDMDVLVWIQEHLVNPFFDAVLPVVTRFADKGLGWIALSLILICIPKTRKIGWTMGIAMLLGLIFGNGILKKVIARDRPYTLYESMYSQLYDVFIKNGGPLRLMVPAEKDLSFPSGHTLASFEAAFALFLRNKKWSIPALVLAFTIAFSRLYVCVHYPTDVFAGIVMGIGLAFLGKFIVDKIYGLIDRIRADKAAKKAALSAETAAPGTEENAPEKEETEA